MTRKSVTRNPHLGGQGVESPRAGDDAQVVEPGKEAGL
jgi:hypothetical protein